MLLMNGRNSNLRLGILTPEWNVRNVLWISNPLSNQIYDIFWTNRRLGLSNLNEHKFNHNCEDCVNQLCSCSLEAESTTCIVATIMLSTIKANW